ncbi:MAG TPA: NAD(P)H-dependent oxidoreductase [Vicinamibacterales bacterium]|nr:NAD(P)H-dependent oxidoreductase [Vicinamibacterales bacterium]
MAGVVDRLFEAHLTVRRLDESISFYRDRLGLELAHRAAGDRAAFFWIGAPGSGMLGLWAAGSGPERVTGHVAFATDLAAVLEAADVLHRSGLTALDFDGRATTEPVVIGWMPAASLYFRDPDGHLLEFIAMLDDSPRPDLGVVSWSEWRHLHAALSPAGVRVLAVSGSLRSGSSNAALVDAAARLAPPRVAVSVYSGLGDIPPFNPDLEGRPVRSVRRFRAALESSDAVLISSPEYAHGVSGVLKNALDWVVGSGELIDKPVALVNASARATLAHASLKETLTTMSARVVEDASIVVPLDGRSWDAVSIAGDARLSRLLADALGALVRGLS